MGASPHPDAAALTDFVAAAGFELDPFQVEACHALAAGRNVLVAAPTGSGKTVVGECAVHLALGQDLRAFYTTPIKALSNQKYRDLCRWLGSDRVGLLTGDTVVNSSAPVIVMTTEVLRNMLYEDSGGLAGLGAVVLDEVHYLADRERGAVWEEVILHLPAAVTLVALSATVSNAEQFGSWIREVRGDTAVVISEQRPVPLEQLVLNDRGLVPLFASGSDRKVNRELFRRADSEASAVRRGGGRPAERGESRGRRRGARRIPRPIVIDQLRRVDLLPALVFIFSRAGCEDAVTQCIRAGVDLVTEAQRDRILEVVDTACAGIPPEDRDVLGFTAWRHGLTLGLAAHHAGLLPMFKETVERLFNEGLVRAVFATETLALGVNMPARTVVIERLIKWDGRAHVDLTPGEYTQLTGRAGRRGIDPVGHAVVLWHAGFEPGQVAGLASTRTYPLRSSFRPNYNMAVNLLKRLDVDAARELLETSFAQYQADERVVGVAAQIRRSERKLAAEESQSQCESGDFGEYWNLRRRLSELEKSVRRDRAASVRAQVTATLAELQPGDVVEIGSGRRLLWAVVVTAAPGDADPRPQLLLADRRLRRFGAGEVSGGVRVTGRIRLPEPIRPRSANWRRETVLALREIHDGATNRPSPELVGPADREEADGRTSEVSALRRRLREHPCHRCPERDEHARQWQRRQVLVDEAERLRQQIATRTGTIARQFDRVVGLLTERGYLESSADGVTPTGAGELLAAVYADQDLLVCEAVRTELFDGLDPADLAGVCSSLVFDRRTDDEDDAALPRHGPLRRPMRRLAELAADLAEHESRYGLEFVRLPDAGMANATAGWARGRGLASTLAEAEVEIGAGDFARVMRQTIDLLRQLLHAPQPGPVPEQLSECARRAIGLLDRGVVSYSSIG